MASISVVLEPFGMGSWAPATGMLRHVPAMRRWDCALLSANGATHAELISPYC
jgi:hypothetical protein